MARVLTRSLLVTVALIVAGCPLTPEFVGATITTTDSGASGEPVATTTGPDEGASTTTAPGDTTGLPGGAYGSVCELVGSRPIINFTAISPQPACDGGICLLVIDKAYQCEADPDCGADAPCDGGICSVSKAMLAEGQRCTQGCEAVADCPPIPGCMTGATCSTVLVSDELCCQKVCVCKDSAYLPGLESLQMLCDEEPELVCQ
ncbi:hypothetical protein [Nannocystis bainbridge]|uniref:Uncharacterized protein n=1 Tax=Nannocystis bainbridge TaxID=2995303 RepID=A0ABT5E867_9BACT|nr:hypothetical protein [Nannocystis bainbridge]MDC0722052.1 hypothetical protein [Nannocystis bainbridge]